MALYTVQKFEVSNIFNVFEKFLMLSNAALIK